jgi:hypothetical protein
LRFLARHTSIAAHAFSLRLQAEPLVGLINTVAGVSSVASVFVENQKVSLAECQCAGFPDLDLSGCSYIILDHQKYPSLSIFPSNTMKIV